MRAANEKRGDGHGVNLTKLREALKDYGTPPNCTSPFAPAWITEIVRRKEAAG